MKLYLSEQFSRKARMKIKELVLWLQKRYELFDGVDTMKVYQSTARLIQGKWFTRRVKPCSCSSNCKCREFGFFCDYCDCFTTNIELRMPGYLIEEVPTLALWFLAHEGFHHATGGAPRKEIEIECQKFAALAVADYKKKRKVEDWKAVYLEMREAVDKSLRRRGFRLVSSPLFPANPKWKIA